MAYARAKAERWMKRQFDELKAYVEQQDAVGYPAEERRNLAAYASGQAPIGHATVALLYLGSYRSAIGCLRVIRGDSGGLCEIDKACLYNYWVIRLLVRAYEVDARPEKQPRVQMDTVANCWMHAEALGATDVVSWLSECVRRINAGERGIGGKTMNALCGLVAHYATGRSAGELENAGWASLGIYESAAAGKLRPVDYDDLAEYHIRRVTGGGYPEFQSNPYCVIPFELLAIERRTNVRIDSKHPLLSSPLAVRRDVSTIAMTDELAGVVDRARLEIGV